MFHLLEDGSNEPPCSGADGVHDPLSGARPGHSMAGPNKKSERTGL